MTTQEAARLVEGRYATGLTIGWRQPAQADQLLTAIVERRKTGSGGRKTGHAAQSATRRLRFPAN
ncbi:hypothetical protein [Sorlinia euscelidii]|uniref:hypothetical protein n=1 Tax=Sorlinia euscelidii TaxID=3081148 RepID=UPI00374E0188